jgi:hypothetical protein
LMSHVPKDKHKNRLLKYWFCSHHLRSNRLSGVNEKEHNGE